MKKDVEENNVKTNEFDFKNLPKTKEEQAIYLKEVTKFQEDNMDSFIDSFKYSELSNKNKALVFAQSAGLAKFTQSFKAWKKEGYQIKKGEKALTIFVPVEKQYFKNSDGTMKNVKYANLKEKQMIRKNKITIFKSTKMIFAGKHFDVAQTTAPSNYLEKKLLKSFNSEHEKKVFEILKSDCKIRNIDVSTTNLLERQVQGKARKIGVEKDIVLSQNIRDRDLVNVLLHEMIHHELHIIDSKFKGDKNKIEVEAELGAFMLSNKLGTPKNQKSSDYINYHLKNLDKEQISSVLENTDIAVTNIYKRIKSAYKNAIKDEDTIAPTKNKSYKKGVVR